MTEWTCGEKKQSSGPSSEPDTLATPRSSKSSGHREEVDSMGVTYRYLAVLKPIEDWLTQVKNAGERVFEADDVPEPMTGDSKAERLVGGKETVLVVEDEQFVLNWAIEALQLLGYTALWAQDPREAINISHTHAGPIHLLVTDVVMPRIDGRSLYERLLESRPEMKVVYMSGYASSLLEHYNVATGDPHFLQKPFALEDLAQKIREALGGPKKAQQR